MAVIARMWDGQLENSSFIPYDMSLASVWTAPSYLVVREYGIGFAGISFVVIVLWLGIFMLIKVRNLFQPSSVHICENNLIFI
jgi:hypothetical protein